MKVFSLGCYDELICCVFGGPPGDPGGSGFGSHGPSFQDSLLDRKSVVGRVEHVFSVLRLSLFFKPSRQDWQSGSEATLLLRELRRKFRTTNMQMERRLREILRSAPVVKGRPSCETLAYASLLSQSWKHHCDLGFKNPFDVSRGAMQAEALAGRHVFFASVFLLLLPST